MPAAKDTAPNEPSNADVLKALEGTNKAIAGLTGGLEKAIGGAFTKALANVRPPAAVPAQQAAKKREPVPDDELEGMSRSDFMKHMMAEIKDSLIDPLKSDLSDTKTDVQKKEVKEKWADFTKDDKNKKLVESLRDELRAVVEESPSLAYRPEDALLLAKERAPDKVKAVEEEASAAAENDPAKKKQEAKVEPAFGGMPPTSGSSGASTDEERRDMPLKEGMEDAWEKTMGALPADLIGSAP